MTDYLIFSRPTPDTKSFSAVYPEFEGGLRAASDRRIVTAPSAEEAAVRVAAKFPTWPAKGCENVLVQQLAASGVPLAPVCFRVERQHVTVSRGWAS